MTGLYDGATSEAIRAFQIDNALRVSGYANIATQLKLDDIVSVWRDLDPRTWQVIDDEDE